jgi:DNA topoisomerase-1
VEKTTKREGTVRKCAQKECDFKEVLVPPEKKPSAAKKAPAKKKSTATGKKAPAKKSAPRKKSTKSDES